MRKYEFRIGDTVREITVDKRPVIGKVIGFGSSADHDFYKISSRGEVYGARDDELELVRRAPNQYEKQGILDQYLLDWYGPDKEPADGEECLVIWRNDDGMKRLDMATWVGAWKMELEPGQYLLLEPELFDAWAPWDWPETGNGKSEIAETAVKFQEGEIGATAHGEIREG